MTVGYLHGFLGSPEVWDGIVIADGVRPALPVEATWSETLAAVARTLAGCEVVVGYSLGARIALGLVAEGHLPRAVLISVNPGIDDADRAARRAADAVWARRFRSEPLAEVLDAWEAQPLFASRPRAARRAQRLGIDGEQAARSLEVLGLAEMPDYRSEVDGRFQLIAGATDAKYVAIARALPAPLTVIAGCGHDPTIEQPDALARVLRELGA